MPCHSVGEIGVDLGAKAAQTIVVERRAEHVAFVVAAVEQARQRHVPLARTDDRIREAGVAIWPKRAILQHFKRDRSGRAPGVAAVGEERQPFAGQDLFVVERRVVEFFERHDARIGERQRFVLPEQIVDRRRSVIFERPARRRAAVVDMGVGVDALFGDFDDQRCGAARGFDGRRLVLNLSPGKSPASSR